MRPPLIVPKVLKVHFLLEPSEMVELEWAKKKVPSKVLKNLTALAEEHRAELLEQWEQIQGN